MERYHISNEGNESAKEDKVHRDNHLGTEWLRNGGAC